MKYRKLPIEIEAVQLTGDNHGIISDFVEGNYAIGADGVSFYIKTLEGDMKASEGDYIIKGVHGEFYPCKPDIFEKTYEKC